MSARQGCIDNKVRVCARPKYTVTNAHHKGHTEIDFFPLTTFLLGPRCKQGDSVKGDAGDKNQHFSETTYMYGANCGVHSTQKTYEKASSLLNFISLNCQAFELVDENGDDGGVG
jgi:hypothetical protein